MINPAGVSGEASSGEKRFCVQTEFAPRPKPRITTSIALNGEVVQKVENLWDKLPQSEEDRDQIERVLRKQHQQVINDIEQRGDRFALSEKDPTKTASSEQMQNEKLIAKIKGAISGNEGITGCVLFSSEDQIIGRDILGTKDQALVDLSQATKDLVSFLSSVSKVGNPAGGLFKYEQMRTVFIPIENNFLALRVNPDVDVKQLVQSIKSTI
jgi:hypothetical protein